MSAPKSFWGLVESEDPALFTYANRPEHSDAEHRAWIMGMNAGRLEAVYELCRYHDNDGITDLAYALEKYLAVQRALRRQRNAVQFARSLGAALRGAEEPPTVTDEDIAREDAINDELNDNTEGDLE